MRVVKEITDKPFKVTIFSWNEKYLIKLEDGPFEQTFKVSVFDFLEEELEALLNDAFMEEAQARFSDMAMSLKKAIEH